MQQLPPRRLMDAMTAEFVVQGHSLSISCSLGISIFPEHGADGETLIKKPMRPCIAPKRVDVTISDSLRRT